MNEDLNQPIDPAPLSEIARYPSDAAAQEHALVVLAMGNDCQVNEDHGLHVDAAVADAAREELKCYDDEQSTPIHQAPNTITPHPSGWPLYVLWASILISVHLLQQRWPSIQDIGASSSLALVDQAQWWRPFTALFLHADVAHLLGNLLSSLLFGTLLAKSIGPLRAWFWTLLCGTSANLVNALSTYPEPFQAIGASTAVFAALGILSGFGLAILLHHHTRLPWLRIISPLLAGIIILGMIGGNSTDGRTDVLGHILGFTSGLPAGYFHGWFSRPSRMHRVAEP